MATGTPKTNGRKNQSISLTYDLKASESEILSSPPSPLTTFSNLGGGYSTPPCNRLYFGDNLGVLAQLLSDPVICGKINLVYIDPPFSTQSNFFSRQFTHAYEDTLTGGEFLEFIRNRLIFLRELLSPLGSIYVHIDEKMVFHLKVIMDEIFGSSNFKNCITRKKCNPKNYTRKAFGNVSDYILFYTKTENYVWNKPLEVWTEERAKEYQYFESETGRRFMKVPVHAPGTRNGETGKPWRGKLPPPGKHWQYLPSKLDEMDARGEIYWSENGNPRRKVYLDQSPGVGIQDIWLDFKDAHNQNIKITGYPTEKNPGLIERIIQASSNPGDLILDCFSGSGTTLEVADKLKRAWIGIDSSFEAIKTTFERLKNGTKAMGDYVKREEKEIAVQLSLFDSLNNSESNSSIEEKNLPKSFIFYIESEKIKVSQILIDTFHAFFTSNGKSEFSHCGVKEQSEFEEAQIFLSRRDKFLGKIIKKIGNCNLKPKSGFIFLLEAIISQQLSAKAASTISERVKTLFKDGIYSPESFVSIKNPSLKDAGVSSKKIEYLSCLAKSINNGELDLLSLNCKTQDEILNELTKIKGIGLWTAEMYLIFALNKLDVFPASDKALLRIIKKYYNVGEDKEIEQISSKWKPFRSIASWYLYKADHI